MRTSAELKLELKKLVIETLKIPDVKPEEICDDENLFEGGLGIDSVDALELVMALQRTYKVHINDQNLARFIIKSIDTIAEFIVKEQEKMEEQKT
jgi:acyl carrier protein